VEYFHIQEGNDFVDSMGGNLKDSEGIDAQQDHPRRIGDHLAGCMRTPRCFVLSGEKLTVCLVVFWRANRLHWPRPESIVVEF
jgi:hypothetical protein